MSAECSFTGNYIQCDVDVEALGNLGANNVLHMAMIEKEIGHNVKTNGETTFYNVSVSYTHLTLPTILLV